VVFGGQAVCGMDIRPVDSNTHLVGGQGSCAAGGRQEKQQTQRFPHFPLQCHLHFRKLHVFFRCIIIETKNPESPKRKSPSPRSIFAAAFFPVDFKIIPV